MFGEQVLENVYDEFIKDFDSLEKYQNIFKDGGFI